MRSSQAYTPPKVGWRTYLLGRLLDLSRDSPAFRLAAHQDVYLISCLTDTESTGAPSALRTRVFVDQKTTGHLLLPKSSVVGHVSRRSSRVTSLQPLSLLVIRRHKWSSTIRLASPRLVSVDPRRVVTSRTLQLSQRIIPQRAFGLAISSRISSVTLARSMRT